MAVNTVFRFLQEVHGELLKVVWPRKEEFWGSFIVVLVLVAIFSLYLGALDLMFSFLARFVFRWYGG